MGLNLTVSTVCVLELSEYMISLCCAGKNWKSLGAVTFHLNTLGNTATSSYKDKSSYELINLYTAKSGYSVDADKVIWIYTVFHAAMNNGEYNEITEQGIETDWKTKMDETSYNIIDFNSITRVRL